MRRFFALVLVFAMLFVAVPCISAKAAKEDKPDIWDGSVATGFASGTGTQKDPYIIETAEQLAYLAKTVNEKENFYQNQYVVLASDIYLNDVSNDRWINNANEWTGIGYYDISFEAYKTPGFYGVFDGGGHTIYGLRPGYNYESSGLFGYIAATGVVKNLTINQSYITGNGCIGAIAGYSEGTIQRCANLSPVSSPASFVGGIVGSASPNAVIECCYNGGTVSNEANNVGGISGNGGTIRNCYNYGNVSGEDCVGGICGYGGIYLGSIEHCYNIGKVTATDNRSGAIVGGRNNNFLPRECYYLEETVTDGAGTKQNGIGCEELGSHTADTQGVTTALSAAQLSKKESFAGFDFENVWTMDTVLQYTAPTIRKIPYESVYGWPLTNQAVSFGYPEKYKIPIERYQEAYGYKPLKQLIAPIEQFFTPWEGSCFGLSLLSIGTYYGDVSLSESGLRNLYNYGYDQIFTATGSMENGAVSKGQQCFAVDERARNLIERAQIMQTLSGYKEKELFRGDADFSELINFLNSDDARPILTMLDFGDDGGHAVVITNDYKPIQVAEGTYLIPIYDPSCPANSNQLTSPMVYYGLESAVMISTNTQKWSYEIADTQTFYVADYWLFGSFNPSIRFFDMEPLTESFYNSATKLYGNNLLLSAASVKIVDDMGTILFQQDGSVIEMLAENCDYSPYFENTTNSDVTRKVVFNTNSQNLIITADSAGEMLLVGEKYYYSIAFENGGTVEIDTDKGVISSIGKSGGNITIAMQDLAGNTCVSVTTANPENGKVSMALSQDQYVITEHCADLGLQYAYDNLTEDQIQVVRFAGESAQPESGKTQSGNNNQLSKLILIGMIALYIIIIILAIIFVTRYIKKLKRNEGSQ